MSRLAISKSPGQGCWQGKPSILFKRRCLQMDMAVLLLSMLPKHGHVSAEGITNIVRSRNMGEAKQLNLARDVARCGRVWAKRRMGPERLFVRQSMMILHAKCIKERGTITQKIASDRGDQIRVLEWGGSRALVPRCKSRVFWRRCFAHLWTLSRILAINRPNSYQKDSRGTWTRFFCVFVGRVEASGSRDHVLWFCCSLQTKTWNIA